MPRQDTTPDPSPPTPVSVPVPRVDLSLPSVLSWVLGVVSLLVSSNKTDLSKNGTGGEEGKQNFITDFGHRLWVPGSISLNLSVYLSL